MTTLVYRCNANSPPRSKFILLCLPDIALLGGRRSSPARRWTRMHRGSRTDIVIGVGSFSVHDLFFLARPPFAFVRERVILCGTFSAAWRWIMWDSATIDRHRYSLFDPIRTLSSVGYPDAVQRDTYHSRQHITRLTGGDWTCILNRGLPGALDLDHPLGGWNLKTH